MYEIKGPKGNVQIEVLKSVLWNWTWNL